MGKILNQINCPSCNKTFSNKYNMKRHYNNFCEANKSNDNISQNMENGLSKNNSFIAKQLKDNNNLDLDYLNLNYYCLSIII